MPKSGAGGVGADHGSPHAAAEPATDPESVAARRTSLAWVAPLAYYTVLIGIAGYLLATLDWRVLDGLRPEWGWIAVATLTGLASRVLMIATWLVILRGLGARRGLDVSALAYVYAKSWLGRYIPGTVPWILGKIYFASRQGLSVRKLTTSSLLEAGLQTLVGLVVGIALILFAPRAAPLPTALVATMIGAIAVGGVLLLPPVFNRAMQFAARLFRRPPIAAEDLPGYRTVGSGAGLYVVVAVANGASLFFIALALEPGLPAAVFLYCVGALALASAVGMLAVFAPGGIGVREAVLVVLLGAVMPTEAALAIAVVTRAWSIAVDLLFVGAAAANLRIGRARPHSPAGTRR